MLTYKQSVGKRIVTLRKEKDWSQLRLSTEVDMDNGDLSRMESGQLNFCSETLERIITTLGVTYIEFYSKLE